MSLKTAGIIWYLDHNCEWLLLNRRLMQKQKRATLQKLLLEKFKANKNALKVLNKSYTKNVGDEVREYKHMPHESEILGHLNVVVSSLIHSYETVEYDGGVMYHRGSNNWSKFMQTRLNQAYIRGVISLLEATGYIEHRQGHPGGIDQQGVPYRAQCSRMRPKKKLINLAIANGIHLRICQEEPVVIIRKYVGDYERKKWDADEEKYEWDQYEKVIDEPVSELNPNATQMIEEIKSYNQLLQKTRFKYKAVNIHPVTGQRRFVHYTNFQHYRRVFNDSLDRGGRLYSPWQSLCQKKNRSKIFMNETKCIELDYIGLHPKLLYASEVGTSYEQDPYLMDGLEKESIFDHSVFGNDLALVKKAVRMLCKLALNMLLNASKAEKGVDALRKKIIDDTDNKLQEFIKYQVTGQIPPTSKQFQYGSLRQKDQKIVQNWK
jgi:hypothetical protein